MVHVGASIAAVMLAAMTVARNRLAMDVWLAVLAPLVAVVMLAVLPRIWHRSNWLMGEDAQTGTVLAIAATFPARLLCLQTRRRRRCPTRAVAPQ